MASPSEPTSSTAPSSSSSFTPLHGGCPCQTIRYTLLAPPLFIHCCHCHSCQRESGSAFALNIILESSNVQHNTPTHPDLIPTPTHSTVPQDMARCPVCKVCVWSYYSGTDAVKYVRAGTLDEGHRVEPDIHIYTASKLPWVNLEGCGKPVISEYYDRERYWPKESRDRRKALIANLTLADEAAKLTLTSAAEGAESTEIAEAGETEKV